LSEFLRCLLENQIPQQPAQQQMLIKYIVKTQDYALLHSMLQYHVFSDSLDLARVLIALGTSEGPSANSVAPEVKKQRKQYYEPAF